LGVKDDGQGFDAHLPRTGRHIGLWSMRERVEQLGGQFLIQSERGQGTTIAVTLPL
jgi:signal transduction histidine kinase